MSHPSTESLSWQLRKLQNQLSLMRLDALRARHQAIRPRFEHPVIDKAHAEVFAGLGYRHDEATEALDEMQALIDRKTRDLTT